jgi:preprotein translocase subunit SecG
MEGSGCPSRHLVSVHVSNTLSAAFGAPFDETSIRTLIITTAIVSIPFTLLAIFMNEGHSNGEKTLNSTKEKKRG